MPLQAGTTFGNYQIGAPIGAGGMGEVYRAKDTKLDRDVAIKVLPEELARDQERLTRFEREAKLLAQLNHTNIATIHGLEESDGQPLLVMELVEGDTLAERIARGPLPIDEVIALFTQIAQGLEAAHDKGIIHRDLKPANIKITSDGHVKILDFGLAKAFQDETAPGDDASQSPTRTKGTELGVILGTASYMSPEQARGKLVDKRTDLWAFGCCLYEALTGRKAFVGETTTDTLAAIVNKELDWNAVPAAIPPWLRHLLRRCLKKNARDRLTDAGWARIELSEPRPSTESNDSGGRSPAPATLWLAAVVLAAVLAAATTWVLREPAPEVRKLSITPPPGLTISSDPSTSTGVTLNSSTHATVSADGRWIAYVATSTDGQSQIYLRPIDAFDAHPIDTGNTWPVNPRFSSNSEWLGYYDQEGHIMRVRVDGGRPELVCESGTQLDFDWSPSGGVVFSRYLAGMWQCEPGSVEPVQLTTRDAERGDVEHSTPDVLPDGSGFLFTLSKRSGHELAVYSYADKTLSPLGIEGYSPAYVPTGYIVFGRGNELRAVRFDVSSLEIVGDSIPLFAGISSTGRSSDFDISDNGTLVYVPGATRTLDAGKRHLLWIDRDGQKQELTAPAVDYTDLDISPDGKRVALEVRGPENVDIWVWDFAREASTRVTFDPAVDGVPLWSSNERLLFESHRIPQSNVFEKAFDGTGDAEHLWASPNHQVPLTISPDGKSIVFEERVGPTSNLDLVLFSRDTGLAEPLLATDFNETAAAISPDGNWIAYQSDESGQNEIYVRPFPNVEDRKVPISSTGGTIPIWSADGRELFFLDADDRLTAVTIHLNGDLNPGRPERVLEESFFNTRFRKSYDVSSDGRFLMIEDEQDLVLPTEIHVVINWFEELKRLAAKAQ